MQVRLYGPDELAAPPAENDDDEYEEEAEPDAEFEMPHARVSPRVPATMSGDAAAAAPVKRRSRNRVSSEKGDWSYSRRSGRCRGNGFRIVLSL